jgi:hypothetical protein
MTDTWTVRTTVILLGLFSLIGIGGLIWLISVDKSAEAILPIVSLTSASIGAVSALLVSTRSSPESPQPVVGPGGGPVPVMEERP